jgi:hypothetical protein
MNSEFGGAFFNTEAEVSNLSEDEQIQHAIQNSMESAFGIKPDLSARPPSPPPARPPSPPPARPPSPPPARPPSPPPARPPSPPPARPNNIRIQQNAINRENRRLAQERRSIAAAQAQLQANRSYDTTKENRLRLLGSQLIPTYSDLYYKNKVEDKINELIKKELTKETTSSKEKTDSEMLKLVKTLIRKSAPKKSKKKSAKKKSKKKSVKKKPKKKSVKKKPKKKSKKKIKKK